MPLLDIDRRLLDACLRHEPGSWPEFVDRYVGLIYHVIQHVAHSRSLVLSQEDVEDIAAEVFLQIVEDDYAVLRRFKGECSLPTYLAVVARRACVRELVRRQRERQLGHYTAHRASVSEGADETEPMLAAEEVERLLEELPKREAEVVRLYHLKSLSYRQIAKRLGIAENSVGPVLAKARKRLAKAGARRESGED